MTSSKHKSHLSTKYLDKLRKSLPYGSVTVISEKLGINKSSVSRVLNGLSENEKVIEEALNIVECKQQSVQQLEQRLKEII